MTHSPKAIVHIPGELAADGVQRCVRCHAKLGTYKGDSLGWRVGEPIISDRNGKSASNATEAAKYRQCGPKNDDYCPNCGDGKNDYPCILCGRYERVIDQAATK